MILKNSTKLIIMNFDLLSLQKDFASLQEHPVLF